MEKIKARFIATSLIVSMIVFCGVLVIGDNYKKDLYEQAHLSEEKNANDYKLFIQKEMNANIVFLKGLGELMKNSIAGYEDEKHDPGDYIIEEIFRNINDSENMMSSIYFVYDSTGNGINGDGIIKKEDIKTDLRSRRWYIEALQSEEPIVTDVYKDVNTGKPCVTASYAVRRGDELIGVLSFDIFLEYMYDHYSDVLKKENSYTYIVSPEGIVIIHNQKNLLGFSFKEPQEEYLNDSAIDKTTLKNGYISAFEEMESADSAAVRYRRFSGEAMQGYFSTIPDLGWKVVCVSNVFKLEKAANEHYIFLFSIGFLICIFFTLLTYYSFKKIYEEDSVTGLSTRHYIIKKLRAKASDPDSGANMLLIKLKKSGEIEAEHGGQVLDSLIKSYTRVLKRLFSGKADLCHSGKGNFILLFSRIEDDMEIMIKRHLDELAFFEFSLEGESIQAHLFLALLDFSSEDIRDIDKTLPDVEETIRSLKWGKEKFIHMSASNFTKTNDQTRKKLKFLKEALRDNNIMPFYQPILDLKRNKIEKYEVLMRIHDKGDYLPPFKYITLAEKYGMIEELDIRILERALAYKKEIDTEDKLVFSFNVSGTLLNDNAYLKKATGIIKKYNIQSENIIFEITETERIFNVDGLIQNMNEYKRQGYRFAIDDFGESYSSISYLKNIPVDYIKIDGSFINDIHQKEENLYLVKSIVNMAKAYKKTTIGEFVESEEVLNIIKDIDIDFAQGYHVGKPQISIEKE